MSRLPDPSRVVALNPELYAVTGHARWRAYGLTRDEFGEMVARQHGKCAICALAGKQLVIDHCHATGFVRGLLCSNCNTGLGLLGDSTASLDRAIEYLIRAREACHAAVRREK